MMKHKTWCVLLAVAFILLLFSAARDIRRPAASGGAQRIEVGADRAQTDERENVTSAHELQLRQLETARDAQWMKQQEAAAELQQRQQEATRPLLENPGVSLEITGVAAG